MNEREITNLVIPPFVDTVQLPREHVVLSIPNFLMTLLIFALGPGLGFAGFFLVTSFRRWQGEAEAVPVHQVNSAEE